MPNRKALITGITGQDGSYLAELLLKKNYEVHGLIRPEHLQDIAETPANISHLIDQITLHPGLLENHLSLNHTIRKVKPDECYHLAGPSFVEANFVEEPSILTAHVNGTHALLASIKEIVPNCRFFHAGSSEMFGIARHSPQNEETPFNPRSIYGLAKLSGYHTVRYYRERYGLFACTGILYNHESPRRAPEFLPRKVSISVARIKRGLQKHMMVGNLEAERDWGYAAEYVMAMWKMLNSDYPEDLIIATGQTHSVHELIELAFTYVDLDYREHIIIDQRFYRPNEPVVLCGDTKRMEKKLDWRAEKPFKAIIEEMVCSDMERIASADITIPNNPN